MSPRKSERIMNLAICLLLARRFVEKSQIREVVEGYHDLSDAAFERTFERDKDELRLMGVPVETGSNSALFPDEIGYRIRRKDFELPPISFTPEEYSSAWPRPPPPGRPRPTPRRPAIRPWPSCVPPA